MTDRVILELAARAAGLEEFQYINGQSAYRYKRTGIQYYMPWNPLESPGDALRLAVTLGIEIDIHKKEPVTTSDWRPYTTVYFNIGEYDRTSTEFHAGDPLAATCRAITRAAAEIGKGMEP